MIIIIIFLVFFLRKYQKVILSDLMKNKFYYLLLIVIFLIGFSVRFVNTVNWQHIIQDSQEYIVQAAMISDLGVFRYIHDAPSFSVILSTLIKLSGYNPSLGSLLNIIFGSLSIILIFIFVKLTFKNKIAAIVSSVLLAFSNLHYDISLSGTPISLSIFFMLLMMIMLEVIIQSKQYSWLYFLGVILGFASQIYYIELILVVPIVFYLILVTGFKRKLIIQTGIFLVILLISITPFAILQYNTEFAESVAGSDMTYQPEGINNVICLWFKKKCGFVKLSSVIKHPSPAVNSFDSGFFSYFTYLFLGEGRGYIEKFSPISVFYNDPYNNNRVYVSYLFLFLIGIFAMRNKTKKLLYLLSIFFLFFWFYSSYSLQIFLSMARLEALIIIPFIAYGISYITYLLLNHKYNYMRIALIILLVSVIISPFFTGEHISLYSDYSIFSETNDVSVKHWWGSLECGYPYVLLINYCKIINYKLSAEGVGK